MLIQKDAEDNDTEPDDPEQDGPVGLPQSVAKTA